MPRRSLRRFRIDAASLSKKSRSAMSIFTRLPDSDSRPSAIRSTSNASSRSISPSTLRTVLCFSGSSICWIVVGISFFVRLDAVNTRIASLCFARHEFFCYQIYTTEDQKSCQNESNVNLFAQKGHCEEKPDQGI